VPLSERHGMRDVNIRAKTMHIRPDRGSLKGLGYNWNSTTLRHDEGFVRVGIRNGHQSAPPG
jgi:hypothetical protein